MAAAQSCALPVMLPDPSPLPMPDTRMCVCCSGMEDIPQGVTAVLTESTTDVLSHVAIRARSQGVLLATCFDDGEWQKLTAMQVGGIASAWTAC